MLGHAELLSKAKIVLGHQLISGNLNCTEPDQLVVLMEVSSTEYKNRKSFNFLTILQQKFN